MFRFSKAKKKKLQEAAVNKFLLLDCEDDAMGL